MFRRGLRVEIRIIEVLYLAIGFILPAIALNFVSRDVVITATLLLPIIALLHELIHIAMAKLRGIRYRFVVKRGMMIGLVVTVKSSQEYIVLALSPQIITITMLILFPFTGLEVLLILALFHIALSLEDIMRSIYHLNHVVCLR